MLFYVHYTLRDSHGQIVEEFDDTSNLFEKRGEALKHKAAALEVFNVDNKKGIWSGRVHDMAIRFPVKNYALR